MSDEPSQPIVSTEPATPTDTTGTTPAPIEAAAPPEPAAQPDWRQVIEQAPKDEFVRHPRVAGTAGEIARRMFEQHKADFEARQTAEQQRQQAEADRKAADGERERLRDLRRTDPLAYAQEMEDLEAEQSRQQAESERQASEVKFQEQVRQDNARWFAAGLQRLPDWKEFGESDIQQLAKAVAGLQRDEDVLAAFSAEAIQILAEKRLVRERESFKTKELAKEREAIKKEVAAEFLTKGNAPDLARPQGTTLRQSPDHQDYQKYNDWYEKTVLRQ